MSCSQFSESFSLLCYIFSNTFFRCLMEFVSSCHSNVFSPEPIRITLNWSFFHSVSRSENVTIDGELILSQNIKMISMLLECRMSLSRVSHRATESSQVHLCCVKIRKLEMIKWWSAMLWQISQTIDLCQSTMSTHFLIIYWLTCHRPRLWQ